MSFRLSFHQVLQLVRLPSFSTKFILFSASGYSRRPIVYHDSPSCEKSYVPSTFYAFADCPLIFDVRQDIFHDTWKLECTCNIAHARARKRLLSRGDLIKPVIARLDQTRHNELVRKIYTSDTKMPAVLLVAKERKGERSEKHRVHEKASD